MECQGSSFVRSHQRKPSNEGLKYSTDSVLSLINNFVRSVGAMEDTVLVPSRLMDVAVNSNRETGDLSPSDAMLHRAVPKWAGKSHADLFSFFSAIKEAHNTLMWGGKDRLQHLAVKNGNQINNSDKRFSFSITPTVQITPVTGGGDHHQQLTIIRQPSSASLVSGFEEDAEVDADAEVSSTDDSSDSGLDQEQRARDDTLRQMSDKFAGHLCGLLDCLQEFTAAAHVVAQRYQEEVGNF